MERRKTMIELIFMFCLGACVSLVGMIIYNIKKTRQFWHEATLGMTDFDIKCMNYEYSRRKSKDNTMTNKMEQFAAMFGKKLNEEFTIECGGRRYKAYFKKSGIRVHAMYYDLWDSVLIGLITGDATIVG